MSVIVWPTTLPLPLVDSVSGAPYNPVVAAPLSSGDITRRRRYFGPYPIDYGAQLQMSVAQWKSFRHFYDTTSDNGSAVFELSLRHPITSDLVTWKMRFAGPYQGSYEDGRWQVTIRLQLLYPSVLAPAAAAVGWVSFLVQPDLAVFELSDGAQLLVKAE